MPPWGFEVQTKAWFAAVVGIANVSLALLSVGANAEPASSGWTEPVRLRDSFVEESFNSRMGTNMAGDAVFVWSEYLPGGVDVIHARRYSASTGWSASDVIQTELGSTSAPVAPAVDPAGNAYVMWVQQEAFLEVWAVRFDVAAGWGEPHRLDAGINDASRLGVTVDDSGNATFIWQQSDNTKNDVWSARYVPGTGWTAAATIESGDGGATQPKVEADQAGNVVAVWLQLDTATSFRSVWANRFTAGAWGSPVLVSGAGATASSDNPQLDVAPDGRAVVVWSRPAAGLNSSWSSFYAPGTGWGAPLLVESDDTVDSLVSDVAMDGQGNAIAGFLLCPSSCFQWAARSNGSASWGAPVRLASAQAEQALGARIDANPRGEAIVLWRDVAAGGHNDIWAARFTPEGGWAAGAPIERSQRGNATSPWVAMDGHGNAYAGWDEYTTAFGEAWAAVYIAPGNSVEDRLAAANAELEAAKSDLSDAQAELEALQVDNARTRNDLQNSTNNVASLSGQVATLSILAAAGLFAGIAAIGLELVRAGRERGAPPSSEKPRESPPPQK